MKKRRINFGIIAAFVIIALLNQCREANITRESKIADSINFNTVDIQLEDILTPPKGTNELEIVDYYMEEVPKSR